LDFFEAHQLEQTPDYQAFRARIRLRHTAPFRALPEPKRDGNSSWVGELETHGADGGAPFEVVVRRSLGFHPPMTSAEALQVFRDSGALLEGHFVLRSGLHSRQYFQCALALQHMPVVERFGRALKNQVRPLGAQTVVSPAMGGLVIGQEVARQLGLRFIFAEKEEGRLCLRRGFKIASGEKCLVVEDVVTQGGRVQETMDLVRAGGGEVLGVAVVVDRSNGRVGFGVPLVSLVALRVEAFLPDQLPPDLAALPAVKPGSK